jgi:hypothetical protein
MRKEERRGEQIERGEKKKDLNMIIFEMSNLLVPPLGLGKLVFFLGVAVSTNL